ncbi:cation:proton antiporter [Mycolicibacterium thermoresistibile]
MIFDLITIGFGAAGVVFFTAGTIGLLRFPDLRSRLHALSKADNLGLGLILIALMAQADSFAVAAKLLLIWGVGVVRRGHQRRAAGPPGRPGGPGWLSSYSMCCSGRRC